MKKVFIFGNGLGMSISPSSYNLNSVMARVWSDDLITPNQKSLIVACLPKGASRPESEEQLATLQEIVGACEVLLSIRETDVGHWLSSHGTQFPDAVHRFAFHVARGMHLATYEYGDKKGEPCRLPNDFAGPLAETVKGGNCHIATLNYDGLLSHSLTESGLLPDTTRTENLGEAVSSILLDGFIDSKFSRDNMFRKRNQGAWYMHLHGCPLFADREKTKPYRLTGAALQNNSKVLKNVGRHIVLTHFEHKPAIINASEILKTYWEFLDRAIDESVEILLFGYSGNDLHLNRLIAQMRGGKTVRVVEWLGSGTKQTRSKFWSEQLGGSVELQLMEDVLAFSDW